MVQEASVDAAVKLSVGFIPSYHGGLKFSISWCASPSSSPRDRSVPPRNWVSFTFTAILFLGVAKEPEFFTGTWYVGIQGEVAV